MFRRKKKYSVLKLFSALNTAQAKLLDVPSLAATMYGFIISANKCASVQYDINFGADEGLLESAIDELVAKQEACVYLALFCVDGLNLGHYSNMLLNTDFMDNSKIGVIDVYLVFPFGLFSSGDFLMVVREIEKKFPLDYGYLVDLTTNYHFGSEIKIKKGLWGMSLSNTKENICWRTNGEMIKDGFFKNIYNFNIVSEAQYERFKHFSVSSTDITPKLKLVLLSDEELLKIKDYFCKQGWLMGDKKCYKKFIENLNRNVI